MLPLAKRISPICHIGTPIMPLTFDYSISRLEYAPVIGVVPFD